MHIPDGFLTPPVWATLDVAGVASVSLLARKAKAELDESRIPLLGVMGAFVFAAQMINFPVGLGTSGHLVGGALLAYILGPGPAAMVMTAILSIQALVFQDGGVLALGPNILNMAFAGVFAGYLPVHYFGARSRPLALFTGAFLSVMVSALLALSELLLSGVRMPAGLLWLSLALFAVSAIVEGLITVAAVEAIGRLQPSWVRANGRVRSPALVTVALTAILLASIGITVASASPDGLEKVIAQTGSAGRSLFQSPLAEYQLYGLGSGWAPKAVAGVAGVILVFALCSGVARLARHRGQAGGSGGGI
jgi:cobalt/nickel transport system permease protein